MRTVVIGVGLLLGVTGCAAKQSSLLLERRVRGSMTEEALVAQPVTWHLVPVMQTQTKGDIEVNVNYASREYLDNFFKNPAMFGNFAGKNPYYPEHMVFYVKIANRSESRIFINPIEFVLLDDHGNQHQTLGQDYITAFAEYHQPVATATRSVLEEARPGYFGVSLPIGKFLANKPQGDFALLLRSALKTGPLFPGTVYDGLISFWNPRADTKSLHLVIANIKTAFDADDLPKSAVDFIFEFTASNQ